MGKDETISDVGFVRKRKCLKLTCLGLDHISCCNIADYLAWRNHYMVPKLEWNSQTYSFDAKNDSGKVIFSIMVK